MFLDISLISKYSLGQFLHTSQVSLNARISLHGISVFYLVRIVWLYHTTRTVCHLWHSYLGPSNGLEENNYPPTSTYMSDSVSVTEERKRLEHLCLLLWLPNIGRLCDQDLCKQFSAFGPNLISQCKLEILSKMAAMSLHM